MVQQTLVNVFSDYDKKIDIFKNRDVLGHDYIPDTVMHRDNEKKQLVSILFPCLKGSRASNTFVYGKPGTGKTLVTKNATLELEAKSDKIKVLYINCKMKRVSDTEYRLLAELSNMLGRNVPPTGLPTEEVYKIFYHALESLKKNMILVLDEVDTIIKKIGDEILYNLTRINQELPNIRVSIIGISNDVSFIDTLDPRVRSSLSEEEVIFPPYNASQLQDILNQRAAMAFNVGVLDQGVIQKCAALAAQEHGDARKALDLLRIAGELAERHEQQKVTTEHIDMAENKLDLDKYVEIVRLQPKQSQAVLAATIKLIEKSQKNIQTGDVFSVYEEICSNNGLKVLTQRRVSDLIAELDMQGIINTRVISKGRYGRTREIRVLLGKPITERIKKTLKDSHLL